MHYTSTRRAGLQLATVLALAISTSCETITGVAPKDTPRVEIELAVIVADEFVEPLVDVDGQSALIARVNEAVRGEADLGLRFYPTPSDRYASTDVRPPYLMTVELDRLSFDFDHDMVEQDGSEPRIEASLDRIHCAVTASVERRRDNGPPLVVAISEASSRVTAERKPEALASRPGYTPRLEGATLKVLEDDIVRAVEIAVDRALKSMRTPIDREFAAGIAPAASSEAK